MKRWVSRREKRQRDRLERRFPVLRFLRQRRDYWAGGGEFDQTRYVFANGSSIAFGPVEHPLISTQTDLLWDPTQKSP